LIISKVEALEYLARAREASSSVEWIDSHISPFEVIFNKFHYAFSKQKGLASIDDSQYSPPSVGPLRIDHESVQTIPSTMKMELNTLSAFLYKSAYAHIGPKVLEDQMTLSGIKRCLLLPVLHPDSDGTKEMDLVAGIYGNDERFMLGFCVPNDIANSDLVKELNAVVSRYGIKAIKAHPNITGINLGTEAGKERIEAILAACSITGLPLFIHGGMSPVTMNPTSRSYACLDNLSDINWARATTPIVISHAGIYGATAAEINGDLLDKLRKMLDINELMSIDLAGLDFSVLCRIFRVIDTKRIVFGSDFHYFTQWGGVVKVLRALSSVFPEYEDRLQDIMSRNPKRLFFGGHRKCGAQLKLT